MRAEASSESAASHHDTDRQNRDSALVAAMMIKPTGRTAWQVPSRGDKGCFKPRPGERNSQLLVTKYSWPETRKEVVKRGVISP